MPKKLALLSCFFKLYNTVVTQIKYIFGFACINRVVDPDPVGFKTFAG